MKHEHASTGSLATDTGGFRFAGGLVSLLRPAKFNSASRMNQCLLLVTLLLALSPAGLMAVVTGSISGTAKDASGAVIPGVSVTARNTQTGVVQAIQTDSVGFYNFPALAVGQYDVSFQKSGFGTYRLAGLVINVDTALRVDAVLQVGAVTQEVTVTAAAAQVDTRTTQTGEIIEGTEMTNMPLNGRAYTDLLALQPGVVPMNVSMYGYLSPSGSLNAGVLSMNGQRDVNNGFMVNGANTVEGFGGGATIMPNLDSIAEFRIITSNAGAEYGNYSGGQVNVATKSGTNQFHGDAFEFLRNSDMDSRNFFSPTRGVFHQNQFGATFGGPIRRDKVFFFGDYQGTRQVIGVDTGLELVPSVNDRTGNLSDQASTIRSGNTVDGQYFGNILASGLGYPVTAGEPYFGCTSSANCVFPGYVIPQGAWSTVSPHVLPLIPPPNFGPYFTTSAAPETLTDDKWGVRIDGNSRWGMLSAYYHNNPWTQLEPYSYDGEGTTVPGFPFKNLGKAQLLTLSATTSLGSTTVNQFTFSYMRNNNTSGQLVSYTAGLTEAALGIAPPADGGIYQFSDKYGTIPEMSFNNYGLGPLSNLGLQINNTFQWQDDFTKVVGTHTLKFGGGYHLDQVNIHEPNDNNNGDYGFTGTETGFDFADMLIGAPNFFVQSSPSASDLVNYYVGAYGEDSWRVTHNLTLNYGVRWEATPYWATTNKIQDPDLILGEQSKLFPTAPLGFVFPGDPGVPRHLANTRWNDFAPRLGLAYAPNFSSGFLHKIFGDSGQSSIRAGYGTYFTNIEGAASWDFGAPTHLYYESAAPPLFAQPFITRSSGQNQGQRFPLPLPPSNVSASNPDSNINWAEFEPLSAVTPLVNEPMPYSEHVMVSFQRQLASNTLLNLSYVGTFGHHLLLDIDANPGNQKLCLSLSQPSEVLPGTSTCGPFGANGVYYPLSGGVVNGTRAPFGPLYSGAGYFLNEGNSDFHALEATLRHTAGRAQFLLSYTYSKSMDDGSAFGDQVLATHYNLFEALSAFDITHNFTFSYTYEVPFDKLFGRNNRATRGWKVSGITRFTTGVPVQISEVDDQSLLGSTGNSPQYSSTDEPNYTPGKILNDTNPRDAKPYFNASLFSQEPLGGQGTSARRFFHGPGINNWDLALLKDIRLTESKKLEFRGELFNAFNHAQFYGSGAVNGNFDAGLGAFGMVTNAAAPRIAQVGAKFIF